MSQQPDNPTKKYQPGMLGGVGGGLAYALDNKPWFNYWDIPRLQREPYINFLRSIWVSPLQQVTWSIKANSPQVAETVQQAFHRFWTKSVPSLMRRYFFWGYAPGGAEFRVKDGRWKLDTVRPIEPRDAQVMVWAKGGRAGEFAGYTTATTGKVGHPYAFWFRGRGEFGRFYDQPPAANLFDAWTEYGTRGGAKHLRQLYMRKHSVSPAKAYFKPGETTWSNADGSTSTIDNKMLALATLEAHEAGSNLAIASEFDDKGNRLWDVIPAEVKADAKTVSEYPNQLKREMAEAVGIPFEVIQAAESGSGYSGRSVPYMTWLGLMDEFAGLLVDQFEESPLRHLVRVNHGPKADFEISLRSLLKDFQQQQNGGQQPQQQDGRENQLATPQARPQQAQPLAQQPTAGQLGVQSVPTPQSSAPLPPADQSFSQIDKPLAPAVGIDHQEGSVDDSPMELGQIALMAMLELQEEATESGDPELYSQAIKELSQIIGDPAALREALGESFSMSWGPYQGPRGGQGWVNSTTKEVRRVKQKPRDDAEPGSAQPATRRTRKTPEEAEKIVSSVTDLVSSKADPSQAAESVKRLPEAMKAAAESLSSLTIPQLRTLRQKLSASWGGARRKADMVAALKSHIRNVVASIESGIEGPESTPPENPQALAVTAEPPASEPRPDVANPEAPSATPEPSTESQQPPKPSAETPAEQSTAKLDASFGRPKLYTKVARYASADPNQLEQLGKKAESIREQAIARHQGTPLEQTSKKYFQGKNLIEDLLASPEEHDSEIQRLHLLLEDEKNKPSTLQRIGRVIAAPYKAVERGLDTVGNYLVDKVLGRQNPKNQQPYNMSMSAIDQSVSRSIQARLGQQSYEMGAAKAPAGGVTVQGKKYKGGQFIPGDVMAAATTAERAAVEGTNLSPVDTPRGTPAGQPSSPPPPPLPPQELKKVEIDFQQKKPNHPIAKKIAGDTEVRKIMETLISDESVISRKIGRKIAVELHNQAMDLMDQQSAIGKTENYKEAIEVGNKAIAALNKSIQYDREWFDGVIVARKKLYDLLTVPESKQKPVVSTFAIPDSLLGKAMKIIGLGKLVKKKTYTPEESAAKAIAETNDLISRICRVDTPLEVAYDASPTGRAGYSPDDKQIFIGIKPLLTREVDQEGVIPTHESSILHEMGHAIEEQKPGVRELAVEFIKYRVGDEPFTDMGKFDKGMKGEEGRKDNFDRHFDETSAYYVGKVYKYKGMTSTEVVSMGIEALRRDPVGFMNDDPEYAALIIKILRM